MNFSYERRPEAGGYYVWADPGTGKFQYVGRVHKSRSGHWFGSLPTSGAQAGPYLTRLEASRWLAEVMRSYGGLSRRKHKGR
jgi:hypothetical protein